MPKLLWAQKQAIETSPGVVVDRALEAAGALVGNSRVTCIPVDRTATIPAPVDIFYDPIPDPDGDLILSEIMAARAQEILLLADERSGGLVDIYWSGGVDSTAALVALIKEAGLEATERLTIWATEESIREYPKFWRQYRAFYRFMHVFSDPVFNQPHNHFSVNHSAVKVTGECGDQLHGSARYYQPGAEAAVAAVLEGPHGERLREQSKKAPYDLAHWRDWLWWWNFSLKWVSVCWRVCALGRTAALAHQAFFRTADFQAWAQANPDLRADRPYRQELKEYIEAFTKDSEYTKTKGKIGSLGTESGPLVAAIVDDGSYLKSDDPALADFVV